MDDLRRRRSAVTRWISEHLATTKPRSSPRGSRGPTSRGAHLSKVGPRAARGRASGEIPEWPKGSDCKSDGTAFTGSNPVLPTNAHHPRPRALEPSLEPLVPAPRAGLNRRGASEAVVTARGTPARRAEGAPPIIEVRPMPRWARVLLEELRAPTRTPPPSSRWRHRTAADGGTAQQRRAAPHNSGGRSSMVERQPSKLNTWVRFPSPAPAPPRVVTLLPSRSANRPRDVPFPCRSRTAPEPRRSRRSGRITPLL